MSKRTRVIYVLLALFFAASAVGLGYEVLINGSLAKYFYAEWYDTAASIGDLVAASRQHGSFESKEHPEQVVWAVELNETRMHQNARVDYKTGISLDGWGSPILLWSVQEDRALKFVSFGPNQRDDNGAVDDLVAECIKFGGCKWSGWPMGLRVLRGPATCYVLLGAALAFAFSLYKATYGHRLCWHVFIALVSVFGGAATLVATTRATQDLRGNPIFGMSSLGFVSVSQGRLTWVLSVPHAEPPEQIPVYGRMCGTQLGGGENIADVGPFRMGRIGDLYFASIPLWLAITAFSLYPIGVFPIVFRRQLRRRRQRADFCVKCGYNLTGLPKPRCPECGTPFAKQLD